MTGVLMVAGAGRSGTSTVAGSLSKLGLYLPRPEVPADDTNPRGFFESQWVVDFHKELLTRSPVVRTIDSRPEAVGLARSRSDDPRVVSRLDDWLGRQLGEPVIRPQVLVKDPRAVWFHDLWRTACAGRDVELQFLTMLRHPAEVAASRDTHYTPTDRGEGFRRQRATANVAGWCNVNLVTEQVTRADRRVFVRYADLLADWRAALGPVVERLGLDVDLAGGSAQDVDAFVEPTLRRADASWEALDVPDTLRAVAEGVWEQANALVDDPADAAAIAAMAALRADYDRLHDHAVAVALDHTQAREVHVRRNAKANTAREYQERIDELEQQLEEVNDAGATSSRWFGRR